MLDSRWLFAWDRLGGHAELLRALYAEHEGKPHYPGLIASVGDGVIAMALEREDAVEHWRRMIGPTDPRVARKTAPDSLRALYGGLDTPDNAVHGSDSVESANRAIGIFFPRLALLPAPPTTGAVIEGSAAT